MRTLFNLVIVSAAALLLGACHTSHGWVKYSSNEDGFTVYMPAEPAKTVKQEATPFGKQSVHYFSWKPGTFDINKLKLLQVTYTDCPKRAAADSTSLNVALDSTINSQKKNYTDMEIESERVMLEGYPGRAFIFQDDKENSTTIVKQIMANNKIYTITAVAKKDYPTNDELNTFFNSFLVLR